MERYLSYLILYDNPSLLEGSAGVEKKDLNAETPYWFCFIYSTIKPSQNESILRHTKPACSGCIIDNIQLNFWMIIASKILMHAKFEKT